MKPLIALLVIALLIGGATGCGKKDKDKDDDEKGAIDTTVDYVTGHTALKAKSKAYRTAMRADVQSAMSLFEFDKGRTPTSLNELVTAGYLGKQYLNDEYGRPVESLVKNGTLIVRSHFVDKETGERSLNWEERF